MTLRLVHRRLPSALSLNTQELRAAAKMWIDGSLWRGGSQRHTPRDRAKIYVVSHPDDAGRAGWKPATARGTGRQIQARMV